MSEAIRRLGISWSQTSLPSGSVTMMKLPTGAIRSCIQRNGRLV